MTSRKVFTSNLGFLAQDLFPSSQPFPILFLLFLFSPLKLPTSRVKGLVSLHFVSRDHAFNSRMCLALQSVMVRTACTHGCLGVCKWAGVVEGDGVRTACTHVCLGVCKRAGVVEGMGLGRGFRTCVHIWFTAMPC